MIMMFRRIRQWFGKVPDVQDTAGLAHVIIEGMRNAVQEEFAGVHKAIEAVNHDITLIQGTQESFATALATIQDEVKSAIGDTGNAITKGVWSVRDVIDKKAKADNDVHTNIAAMLNSVHDDVKVSHNIIENTGNVITDAFQLHSQSVQDSIDLMNTDVGGDITAIRAIVDGSHKTLENMGTAIHKALHDSVGNIRLQVGGMKQDIEATVSKVKADVKSMSTTIDGVREAIQQDVVAVNDNIKAMHVDLACTIQEADATESLRGSIDGMQENITLVLTKVEAAYKSIATVQEEVQMMQRDAPEEEIGDVRGGCCDTCMNIMANEHGSGCIRYVCKLTGKELRSVIMKCSEHSPRGATTLSKRCRG